MLQRQGRVERRESVRYYGATMLDVAARLAGLGVRDSRTLLRSGSEGQIALERAFCGIAMSVVLGRQGNYLLSRPGLPRPGRTRAS